MVDKYEQSQKVLETQVEIILSSKNLIFVATTTLLVIGEFVPFTDGWFLTAFLDYFNQKSTPFWI